MENENLNNDKSNDSNQKLNNQLSQINESVKNAKESIETTDKLLTNISNISKNIRDIESIKAITFLENEKLEKSHIENMEIIDKAYSNISRGMVLGENVVDVGLKNNDIDLISKGLDYVIGISNIKPLDNNFRNSIKTKIIDYNKMIDNDEEFIEI